MSRRSPERDRERERERSIYNGDRGSFTERNEAERKWSNRRNVQFKNPDPNNDTEYNNFNLNYNKNEYSSPEKRNKNYQNQSIINNNNNNNSNTSVNVLNCIFMLLKELNEKDLYSLKLDVDRRVQK